MAPNQELKRLSDQLGYQLLQLGLRHRDVIAILTPNHVEFALVILGAQRIGPCRRRPTLNLSHPRADTWRSLHTPQAWR